jgi:hypothetical protein
MKDFVKKLLLKLLFRSTKKSAADLLIEPLSSSNSANHTNYESFTELKSDSKKLLSLSKYLLLIIFVTIVLLSIIPSLINNSDLKFQLEQEISTNLKTNFKIEAVDISLFPTPKIILKNAAFSNLIKKERVYNLHANAIEIKSGFWSILSRKFLVKEIVFIQASLEQYYQASGILSAKDSAIENLNNSAESTPAIKSSKIALSIFSLNNFNQQNFNLYMVPKITIQDSNFTNYNLFLTKKFIKKINFGLKNSGKKINGKGYFTTNQSINNLDFNLLLKKNAGEESSKLTLISPDIDFAISGKFIIDDAVEQLLAQDSNIAQNFSKINFSGKFLGQVKRVKDFYSDYFSNENVIYNKLNPAAQNISFNASINNSQEGVEVNNLLINSNAINGLGNIKISKDDSKFIIDSDFKLDNLNLDSLWSSNDTNMILNYDNSNLSKSEQGQKNLQLFASLNSKDNDSQNLEDIKIVNQANKLDLNAEINIKKVTYLEAELSDVSLYANSSNFNIISITPLTFKIKDDMVRIAGNLDYNDNLKFAGKINISGQKLQNLLQATNLNLPNLKYDNLKNYSFDSDLLILPNSIILDDIYFRLNNKNEFVGRIDSFNSNGINNIVSNFKVNEIDLNEYFLISRQNIYLSGGLLLKKILWLNNINSAQKITLNFDKVIYKNESFINQNIDIALDRGYLEIKNLFLKSDNTNLNASLVLDIRGSTPRFSMAIIADKFNYQTPQIKEQVTKVISNDKQEISSLLSLQKLPNFTDQLFDLPSFEGIDGKLNLTFNQLQLDQLEAKNFKILGKIKDGNIDFANPEADFSGEIMGGKINFKGNVIIKTDKLVNGNLKLDNIKLGSLLFSMFGINNIDGVANIATTITSLATNKEDFMQQLEATCKFSVSALQINGYGLSDLITKMFDPLNNLESLTKPEDILFNVDAKTVFNQATGELRVEKKKPNQMRVDINSTAVNGVLAGTFDLIEKNLDASANIIFLTGTRKKPTPVNIISNIKGPLNKLMQSTNLTQVNQYLQNLFNNIENKVQISRPLTPQNQNNSITPISSKTAIESNIVAAKAATANLAPINLNNFNNKP